MAEGTGTRDQGLEEFCSSAVLRVLSWSSAVGKSLSVLFDVNTLEEVHDSNLKPGSLTASAYSLNP